jgi:hypothetical protein
MKPHKHAELIKAWADGAEIECKDCGAWYYAKDPRWQEDMEYRIKPEPKPEPVKKMMYLYFVGTNEQKFWISDEPPETYVYRTISQYIGSIEVQK